MERTDVNPQSLIRGPSTAPRLLVSVRSADEALAALCGGVDIIDVKEPFRGPLGMADDEVIRSVAEQVFNEHPRIKLPFGADDPLEGRRPRAFSIALGELTDWFDLVERCPERPLGEYSVENMPFQLPDGVSLVKLGMSGLADRSDWRQQWQRVTTRFNNVRDQAGMSEAFSGDCLRWVAVAYADVDAAKAPDIRSILNTARRLHCCGLLIDTYGKFGGTLLDYLSIAELEDLAAQCHSCGMFFALAGGLSLDSLAALRSVSVDVIGIRSAACRGGQRTGTVDTGGVMAFRDEMERQFRRTPVKA